MYRKQLSVAIVWALLAPGVWAQDPANAAAPETAAQESEAKTLDAVTVTARRRTESIQDVPVAISAFGEEALKDLQADTVEGLQSAVPNMNMVQGRGSANSINVFIRGIGQPDALQTFDPGVGMYVDDVYYSRINGAMFSLFDVQQVEVLRGPQGTLYGKNSTGGAIKVSTKNPFDDNGASVEATVGNFGRREGKFYLGGELSDTIAMSLAGAMLENDGYVRDPLTGRKYNGEETKALRAKIAFRPSDNVTATLSLDHNKQDAPLTLGRPTSPLLQTDLALGTVVLKPAPTGEYDYRSSTSFDPSQGQDMTHQGASLAVDWDMNSQWRFKSISAWRKLKTNSFIDIDASEYELGDVLVAIDQKQKSQEFQFQYDNGSNLQAIFGLYYMNEKVPSYQEAYAGDLFAFAGVPLAFLRTIDDDLQTTSKAAFAHMNWEFMPTWTLAAGLRYSKDEKEYDRSTSTFWDPMFASLDETVAFQGRESWSAWTPSISLQKAFTDNVMGYVSANRGFKSGGFNGRANTVAETTQAVFNPEFVWTYEAGVKMRSNDGRLQGNVTAFHSEYKDFQARVSEIVNPNSPTPDFSFPVLNAAALKMDGIEFEGSALLGEGTKLSGQLSYMNARYDNFADPRLDVSYPGFDPNVSHDHVPFSPKWTGRVALQHTILMDGGAGITIGGDVAYRDDTWLSVDNRSNLMQDGYATYGLFGVWDSSDYAWQVRAGVRNLGDKVYKTDGQEFSSVGNIQTAYYGMPRNYYLSVRYNF